MHLSDDPFPLALLRKEVPEAKIVGDTPEGEVRKEEGTSCL